MAALRKEFKFVEELYSMACQSATERAWIAIDRFYSNCQSQKPGKKKDFRGFRKSTASVEYKTSGWSLHPTKRRINFTDKKGIGEVKLLGKWDIHTYSVKSLKRVRIIKRADGF
jgi:putative transposase